MELLKMSHSIRRFTLADSDRLFALIEREGEEWTYWQGTNRAKYQKALETSIVYLVFEGETLCGYARCRNDDGFGIYVLDLLVDIAHRGKEYGRLLMEQACHDYPNDTVYVTGDVYPYYMKLGYEIEGSIYRVKPKGETTSSTYEICPIDAAIREKAQPILDATWGSPYLAVNGKLWDSRAMPGYAAVNGDEVLGYLFYEIHNGECEIMVLESVVQSIGIASALIDKVKQTAKLSGVGKVVVQTSNDNTHAFRFYQRRGFTIREIRLGALDIARQLKPIVPLIGEDGIPLRDEIEFEIDV